MLTRPLTIFAKGRVTLPTNSNVIHFFRMHNITSVFLLCKLFLLLFLGFPFLVLGYLGHLQPMGHLPVGTKWTAWTHTHTWKHTQSPKSAEAATYSLFGWIYCRGPQFCICPEGCKTSKLIFYCLYWSNKWDIWYWLFIQTSRRSSLDCYVTQKKLLQFLAMIKCK